MTRRKLIWGLVAFVVAFTVAFFLSGEARADVPQGGRDGRVDTWAAYAMAFLFLAFVFYWLIVGAWRRLRDARAVVDAARQLVKRNGPANGAVKPADQPPAGLTNGNTYDAVAEFDAIAERLQRKAAYDSYAAEMYSAFRELDDDDLIENVIDLWGRTYKP